jgi:hypothetical protein
MTKAANGRSLLAVDLGLHTGLALYGPDGRLRRYFSRHFASRPSLRRGAATLLSEFDSVSHLVLEGGGDLAVVWEREAKHRRIELIPIAAEAWREILLLPRERRGNQAKRTALTLARSVIDWSGAPRPTSLRHDTAEAILIGLWGVMEVGWLDELPADLRRE